MLVLLLGLRGPRWDVNYVLVVARMVVMVTTTMFAMFVLAVVSFVLHLMRISQMMDASLLVSAMASAALVLLIRPAMSTFARPLYDGAIMQCLGPVMFIAHLSSLGVNLVMLCLLMSSLARFVSRAVLARQAIAMACAWQAMLLGVSILTWHPYATLRLWFGATPMTRFRHDLQVNELFLGTRHLLFPLVRHALLPAYLMSPSAVALGLGVLWALFALPGLVGPNVLLVAGASRLWMSAIAHAWPLLLGLAIA